MARKEIESGITHHVTAAADTPDLPTMNAASVEQHVNAIALNKELGLALYDRRSSMSQIQFHLRQSTESMLEAGKLLIQMKENEDHGNWLGLLADLGVDVTLANRLRQAALKFSNAAAPQHLIAAAGNRAKLFELMILDDDDIAELNDGGTVAGLQLDDVARMSSKELRAALRAQREKTAEIAKAKDDVISGKSKFIDKLEEKLALATNKKSADITEVAMPGEIQLAMLQGYSRKLTSQITATLNSEIVKLYKEYEGYAPPKHIELAARQAVGLIITAAYGVAENMGFEPILDAEQAADEPGRAEAKAFEEYMAQQNSDLIDESNQLDKESADDWAARENINTEPSAEA